MPDEELAAELGRRRGKKLAGGGMLAAEDAVEQQGHADNHLALQEMFDERMRLQSSRSRPCPQCGRPACVKVKNRSRTVRAMSGELLLRRHYHYCEHCLHGFYPLDVELGLSAEGELSPKMSARVLDFGVTTVFAEVPERWAVHHSGSKVSENLVRVVVDRAGERLEQLGPSERQQSIRDKPEQAPSTLVVQTDGSMLAMREKGQWKEVKVGVIYDDDHHLHGSDAHRGVITEPRYATSMAGIDDFRLELDAALNAERALDAQRIGWIADGAPWNWSLCDELCPAATQILDFMHMVQHATDCGKAVLGEQSPWLSIWTDSIVRRIDRGAVDQVFDQLAEIKNTLNEQASTAVDDLIRYYKTNVTRMNYPLFRQAQLPVGSGAVESSHRHVIQARMKLAGQHWSHPRAHQMARLRAAYKTVGPQQFANVLLPLAA